MALLSVCGNRSSHDRTVDPGAGGLLPACYPCAGGPLSKRDDIHLFIPGPAAAEPSVLAAAGQPIRPHYGDEFVADFDRCRRQLKRVFRTSNDLYLLPGSGTAALEAAITSVLVEGSPVLVLRKGLAAPPGLAPVTVSPQAWDAIEASGDPRAWLFDLRTYRRHERDWAHWHPYSTTMPTGLLMALNVSLELIFEEGLEQRIARTRAPAGRVRQGLRDLGFSMLCDDEHASPITTSRQDLPSRSHGPVDRASGNRSAARCVRRARAGRSSSAAGKRRRERLVTA